MNEKRAHLIEINFLVVFFGLNFLIIFLFIYTMPQFDTFTFLSQLFYVFLFFLFFYLLVCFYLLPAFAAILKTRKHKLAQSFTSLNSDLLINSEFLDHVKISINSIVVKLSSLLPLNTPTNNSIMGQKLNVFSSKFETFRSFNGQLFTQAQLLVLLYI